VITDAELIRRFVERRDEEAFRELYRRYTAPVYGLLVRLTANRSEAADLMQETWLRAASTADVFRAESTFRTWLTGIAVNCFREWLRRRTRTRALEAAPDPVHSPDRQSVSRSDYASIINRGLDVRHILQRVTPDHRAVLVLHDIEGYTHEEMADALGIEVGTAKSRLSRARESFRAQCAMPKTRD
jgi:RNA polymerase sigma-70 factor, ECF subfamily